MLDFQVTLALGDQELTESEWNELMQADEGLALLKGQWVEVDREKLAQALDHWKKLEEDAKNGLSFAEGMRLLAGAPMDLTEQPDEDQHDAQCELPVEQKHGDHDAAQQQNVGGKFDEAVGEHAVDGLGVVGQPAHEIAYAMVVVIFHGERLDMGEKLGADVTHQPLCHHDHDDALAHGGDTCDHIDDQHQNADADQPGHIAGVRVVKAFAREEDTIVQFESVSAENRQVGIKADIITAALGPMFTTMMTITIAVVALLGGWLSLQGIVTVGIIATFVVYVMNFFRPMRGIAMLYNGLQSALAGAERIFEVLDDEPSVANQPDAKPLPKIKGEVTFDDVSFEYEEGKPVLEDVNLTAQPGQTIALVGPTGAGKTTIISLLSRFYDVTEGAILIDGRDIREVEQTSIRDQLGIVLQDTFLFAESVMENIRYGRLAATDEEVIEAARLANADHFIRTLPQGYGTMVSEKGHNFSQGQRQLLAIARAVLADPRILILDEATSSVDTRTEMQIQEALLRLMEGRTAFVIAHRLSTIRNADNVLVVNDHRIIESGTHEELMEQNGFYYDLYMSQYRRVQALAMAA